MNAPSACQSWVITASSEKRRDAMGMKLSLRKMNFEVARFFAPTVKKRSARKQERRNAPPPERSSRRSLPLTFTVSKPPTLSIYRRISLRESCPPPLWGATKQTLRRFTGRSRQSAKKNAYSL